MLTFSYLGITTKKCLLVSVTVVATGRLAFSLLEQFYVSKLCAQVFGHIISFFKLINGRNHSTSFQRAAVLNIQRTMIILDD